ncbi:2-C-methyl-D-erythritol 4-phosphate cytidylyltransferase [Luedemannella flava]|uniref:2-C-methyl-D-erythritol 4-phosphate cytidylyltransferase n=1 Tax=Luedemannella flava TaxID=349316 RepID=A0ABN2MDN5_9ACTN
MTAHAPSRGDVAVLVPAAGLGTRLGPGAPKALRTLAGTPLLVHAARRLAAARSVGCLVVAAPPTDVTAVRDMLAEVATDLIVVAGGDTRQDSVARALAAVPAHFPIVLVHDAARALVPPALVERVAAAVRDGHDAVVPVLPVVDTIRTVDASEVALGTVDRSTLRAVQTPQGFRREVLAAAHEAAGEALTDDAGLAEALGVRVQCVPGDEAALKITRPFDLAIAELLLRP